MNSNSVLRSDNLNKLNELFENEENYRVVMQSLWKTRSGLNRITDDYPEVFPQLEVLNNLIGAFYVNDLSHPVYDLEAETNNSVAAIK